MASFRHYWLTICWFFLILLASLMPASSVPESSVFKGFDKLVHGYLYAQFSMLMLIALHKEHRVEKLLQRPYLISAVAAIAIGVLMEVFQAAVVTSRHFELEDIVANTAGTLIGLAGFKLVYKQ